MNTKQEELISEKAKLQERILELGREKLEISNRIQEIEIELGAENVKSVYGVSKDDRDKKCGRHCSDCILPCNDCIGGKCEQCRYGYVDIVQKIRYRYTNDELNQLKLRCPYALLAVQ